MPIAPVRPLSRRLPRALVLTTACGALFPAMAAAQTAQPRLPRESDVRDVRTDGLRPGFREGGSGLRVDLRGRNTVINWDGFNIPEGREIAFRDGRIGGALRGDIAVLNRDVSGTPSQLLGKLSGDANVAVWVHNANGILVGSKAAFNTGSLVLTTLDISPDEFLAAGNSYRLRTGAADSASAITVQSGAKLRVDGGTRGLVLLAPRIDAHGEFVAEGQDVAFVTASDVTLDFAAGSPLSVTLNRGSAVAGTSQLVRGTVAGANAVFALASQDSLTDSLLQVSAAVTTASEGPRGIVLSAGRPATPVAGVTVGSDTAAVGGPARLLVDGLLRTTGLAAGASGALAFDGNVDASGDVTLRGASVALGGTSLRGGGAIDVTALTGGIAATRAITIGSGSDRAGDVVRLQAAGTQGIVLAEGSSIVGGADRALDVRIFNASDAPLTLGDVTARSLGTIAALDGEAGPGGTFRSSGSLAFGRVDVIGGFAAESSGGDLTIGRIVIGDPSQAIDLRAGGALSILTDIVTDGTVSLKGRAVGFGNVRAAALTVNAASGTVTGGDIATTGGIAIDAASGAVSLGRVEATRGDVVIGAAGPLFARAVTAGGRAMVVANGAGNDVTVVDGVASTGAATVRSGRDILTPFIRSGSGALTVAAPDGRLTGVATGIGTSLSAGAGQPFSLTVGTDAVLGDVIGGNIAITATAISANRIDGGTLPVSLDATRGDLIVTGPVIGSNVSLTAAGRTALGSVDASGAVTLGGARGLSFTNVTGGSIRATGGDIVGTALTASGRVTLDGAAITLGSIASGGDFIADATGAATLSGPVTAGGEYRLTAASIALGTGAATTQRADGAMRLIATGGAITAAPALTLTGGGSVVLDGAGGIDLSGAAIRSGAALGVRAGRGQAIRLGTVAAGSVGGFDGSATTDRLTHDAALTIGDLDVGRIAVTLNAGDLTTGRIAASGAVSLIAGRGSIGAGDLTAQTLDVRAGANLSLGTVAVGGDAAVEGAAVALTALTARSLTLRSAAALGAADGGTTALRTTGGDLTVEAGTARLGRVESAGTATLHGVTIDVRDRLSAARALLVEARSALTMGNANAGGDLTLDVGSVSAGDLSAGGALKVASAAALTMGTGSGTGIALDAGGLIRAGALTGGPSVTIRGADAELTGAIRGSAVRFATRDLATTALRIGDGTQGDGFRLSAAEVGQVAADTLAFDSGTGAMEVGTVALAPAAGRSVEMLSTGTVRVTGQVSATGTGRSLRIGGDTANGNAATIHVVATSDAGGRLSLAGNDLILRGNRIAAGLAPGFLDALLPGDAGRTQAQGLIGNPNSPLYNPQLGGGFFAPDAMTMIAARSLTVRFGDYALFQNTAMPGGASGVTLGSVAVPVTPALRVVGIGAPAGASFAFFGEINGITGAGAALLGRPAIDIQPALLPNSRINGCLAGSGAGCLTTIVIQPTLQVFDWDSQAVFGILQDVSLPFTPVIGGNNEALLSGLPALVPETPADAAAPAPQPQEPQP